MNKTFIPIFLFALIFNLSAMRVPLLREICIKPTADYFYQNFNLDESLPEQTQKVKKCLENLPDPLQEKVINRIDFMLCPQWQEVTRSHECYYQDSLKKYGSHHFGCSSLGFFLHDNDNGITHLKHNLDRNDPLTNIMLMPNSPLLIGISERAILFFSSTLPFKFLGTKELGGDKKCVISTDAKPILYIATPKKILTFSCDSIEDQTAIEGPCLRELSFFNDSLEATDNTILSLALTHDNQFLYIGCKKKPSYKICLATEIVEEMPHETVNGIIISDDDSIVAMTNMKKTTEILSKKTVCVDGVVLCIKNNILIASNQYGDILGYDINGNLLKKFNVRGSLWDKPCYFVPDRNNFPGLIRVDDGYIDQKINIFCESENLTMDSVYKLVFKLAIEKAIDGNRKDILAHLLSDEATLSLFPQPTILRNRIQEKLNEKTHEEFSPGVSCIIS